MKRILLIAVLVGLFVTLLPSAALAAPSLGGLGASPSAGWYSAPPAQGGGIPGKVVAYFVQLFKDARLQVPAGKVWQNYSVEVSSPAGGIRYVRCSQTGVEGWVGEAAIGTSIILHGAFLPTEFTVGAARGMQSISDCQRWLECNGYSRAGTGRVWSWLDRNRILTTRSEDCIPYRRMPRPPGCY